MRLSVLVTFIFSHLFVFQLFAKEPVAWDKLHGLGEVEYFKMENKKQDGIVQPLYIYVRLPEGYDASAKVEYPTLYILDGGANFPLFASYYTHLKLMQDIPDMILIGISYGSSSHEQGNTRGHDFTAPSAERDHYGGAKAFEKFLTEKLMPLVQKNYAIDKKKQILFGQSLGGQFALYSAMYGDAPFYAVLASNPAFHRNLEFFERPLRRRQARPKAFIISAEFDADRFRIPSRKWQKHWSDKAPDWKREYFILPQHNHLSSTPETFRRGLKWAFSNN